MPILRQRKDDGGYYVRASLSGSSAFATWQISPEGIETLRRRGYTGVDFSFPQNVLKELIDRGQAYTHGSGVDLVLPALRVARTDSAVMQAPRSQGSKLVIFPGGGSWELAIQVKEIPRIWSSAVESLVDALSGWELIAEASKVPATQLWPGRGGAHLPVIPRRETYNMRPVGNWPESWDILWWLGSVPGLGSDVTLFSGENGERLDHGLSLEPGESYFLVAPADTSAGRGRWPPPSFLDPDNLGVRDEWQAWSIQVPRSAGIYISAWCDAIGYRLAKSRCRLNLITPPHRYNDQGIPIIFAEEEIVFGLSPVGDSENVEISFYTARFQEPGMYRVAHDDISTAPLHILVERSVIAQPEKPVALSIEVDIYGEKFSLHAFSDGAGPHIIEVPGKLLRQSHDVTINCDVPLNMISSGAVTSRIDQVSAEEAGARIQEQVADAVRRKENLSLQLDAGAYGRLWLEYVVRPILENVGLPLPLLTVRRARWLSAILKGGQHTDALIPLSSSVCRKLARLSVLPECAALRELRAAPASLIPHLHAITRLVQD